MDVGTAIFAGVIATAVMTALMYMARAMGMQMDMPRMLGLAAVGSDHPGMVYLVGFFAHFMMGALFGVVYAALFEVIGVRTDLLWGAIFGVAHGVVAGLAMSMMPAMHPRMGAGQVLSAPGPFAVNWGSMNPAGILMLHVVFGAVVGIIY